MTSTIQGGNRVYSQDYTVTTGSSTYDGYYFGEVDNAVPANARPLSVVAVSTSAGGASNVYLDAQFIGRKVRAWSVRANTTATIRVTYCVDS